MERLLCLLAGYVCGGFLTAELVARHCTGKSAAYLGTGNPGMAKAGMGDLLAGMIGAFAAQKMDLFAAAQAAVYIHGLCGDITARELSQRGMTVSDMAQLLGALMSEFE